MKLTVLGKYGPYPAPGGACSGYLLESGDIRVLIDLGSGTFSRLIELVPELNINAVLLSHLHSDHMSDMLVLRYALAKFSGMGKNVPMPLTVAAPGEPSYEFRQLVASGVFDMTAVYDNMRMHIGDMHITFHRMIHPVPSYAMEISHKNRRLFYTGDTGWFDGLPQLVRGCDLLLCDTGYLSRDKTSKAAAHLTAREAGELARLGDVKRLVCTHLLPGYTDAQILDEAREAYPKASVAEEMKAYMVYNMGVYGA